MSERRLLALLALLIGLLAALLLLLDFARSGFPQGGRDLLDWIWHVAIAAILGLAAIVGSLILYGGKYQAGGIINVVMGIVAILLNFWTAGVLLVFSGILGLVAAGTFDERRRY